MHGFVPLSIRVSRNPSVINARPTSALWKEGPETRHLRLTQPEQIAHDVPLKLGIVNHDRSTTAIS
jgi:actin-like ATPase involved in cell morphogenesis